MCSSYCIDSACYVTQVLELVGTSTLEDSLQCANAHGIVCMTGMVGNKWAFNFSPMESIPEAVYLTKYSGELQLISQPLAVVFQQANYLLEKQLLAICCMSRTGQHQHHFLNCCCCAKWETSTQHVYS